MSNLTRSLVHSNQNACSIPPDLGVQSKTDSLYNVAGQGVHTQPLPVKSPYANFLGRKQALDPEFKIYIIPSLSDVI